MLTSYERGLLATERNDPHTARAELQAAGGDPAALLLLATLDEDRKPELYARAAALGSPEAAFHMATFEEPLHWYRIAADGGHAPALRMLGGLHERDGDHAEAERCYRAAVEAGDEPASLQLGLLFQRVHDDPVTATGWLLRAAETGDAAAWNALQYVDQQLRPLAEAGDDRAATLLGTVLAHHLGDVPGAVAVLEGPAERRHPAAQRTLAELIRPGDPERAAALFETAAEAGDPQAQLHAGLNMDNLTWLRLAADAGVAAAYPALADRLSQLNDDKEALYWYHRAATDGHQPAMRIAATWHRDGYGTSVDHIEALRWYLRLLAAGNGEAVAEMRALAARMTADDIHEAGRRAGRLLDADALTAARPA